MANITDWNTLYERLRARSNRPGHFTSELGLNITRLEHFRCEAEITPTRQENNPRGIIHGGVLYTMIDQVAGLAACTTGRGCVTLDADIHYYCPAEAGQALRCVAEVVKPGKNVTVVTADVIGPNGKTLCTGTFTYFMLEEIIDTLQMCDQAAGRS